MKNDEESWTMYQKHQFSWSGRATSKRSLLPNLERQAFPERTDSFSRNSGGCHKPLQLVVFRDWLAHLTDEIRWSIIKQYKTNWNNMKYLSTPSNGLNMFEFRKPAEGKKQPSNKLPRSIPFHEILKPNCTHDPWALVGFEKCPSACPSVWWLWKCWQGTASAGTSSSGQRREFYWTK